MLTLLVVVLFGKWITDTLTGLKLYPGEFLRHQELSSVGFEGDHEITAKLIKAHVRIVEIPIRYAPRGREEGKKIGPLDGVKAIRTFVAQRFATTKRSSPGSGANPAGAGRLRTGPTAPPGGARRCPGRRSRLLVHTRIPGGPVGPAQTLPAGGSVRMSLA